MGIIVVSSEKVNSRTAVVTGGARGIGKAICRELIETGINVAVVDIAFEAARETARELERKGGQAKAFAANVAKAEEATEMIKAVGNHFGQIDILVNNAGITRDNLIMRMKEEEWDSVLEVNLKSAFNCLKAVVRPMIKAKGGKIVNIASVVGVMGNAGQANYSASKAGMIGLTKSAAKELGSRNINVNAVAPGYIETEMTEKLSDEARQAFLTHIPLNRPGAPQDVARAVKFLVCGDADYITGQILHIDGGMVM